MGGRVEVDRTLPARRVSAQVWNELRADAREAVPEECCGLVLGDEGEPLRRRVKCRNVMTQRHAEDPLRWPRDNRTGFYVDPADLRDAWDEAERAGERVTAVYHSHVGADVYLSDEDLAYTDSIPEAAQIVVAVLPDGRVTDVGIFERESADRPFAGRRLEARAP